MVKYFTHKISSMLLKLYYIFVQNSSFSSTAKLSVDRSYVIDLPLQTLQIVSGQCFLQYLRIIPLFLLKIL